MAEQATDSNVAPPGGTAVTQATPRAAAASSINFGDMGARVVDSLKRGDLGFAIGLVLIMVVLIMPLPPWLLDIALALSITLAVLILMTVVFI